MKPNKLIHQNSNWSPIENRVKIIKFMTDDALISTQAWARRIQFRHSSSNVPNSYSWRRRLLSAVVICSFKFSRFSTSVCVNLVSKFPYKCLGDLDLETTEAKLRVRSPDRRYFVSLFQKISDFYAKISPIWQYKWSN